MVPHYLQSLLHALDAQSHRYLWCSWANWLHCSSSTSRFQPDLEVKVLLHTSIKEEKENPHVICYSNKCSYLHNLAGFNTTANLHLKTDYSTSQHLHGQKQKRENVQLLRHSLRTIISKKLSVSFKMQVCFTELPLQILLFPFQPCLPQHSRLQLRHLHPLAVTGRTHYLYLTYIHFQLQIYWGSLYQCIQKIIQK